MASNCLQLSVPHLAIALIPNLVKHLKKLAYILLSIIVFTSCSKDSCTLDDGKYRVIYDKEFSEFQYEIRSDTVKEIYRDNSVISVIEWISDKEYLLSDLASYLTYKDDLNKEKYTYNTPFYRLNIAKMTQLVFI